jgi:hypothetical protein
MTEKHYAHLAPSYIADTIRAHFPTLGIAEDSKVTPIPGKIHVFVAAETLRCPGRALRRVKLTPNHRRKHCTMSRLVEKPRASRRIGVRRSAALPRESEIDAPGQPAGVDRAAAGDRRRARAAFSRDGTTSRQTRKIVALDQ